MPSTAHVSHRSGAEAAPTVVIMQRRLTHYRLPLFADLKTLLDERGVTLKLLVGRGTPEEEKKRDSGELPWAIQVPTRYALNGKLCWQPVGRHLDGAGLVVTTHENKLLQNHLLMLAPRKFKLAFWGHGANLQSQDPRGWKERFKRWTANRVDWWFPYTQLSADLVARTGFPAERMTVLNNSVDTTAMRRDRQNVSANDIAALREALGFGPGPVGVYVGSLYVDKRIDFLEAAARAVQQQIPDFQMMLIGDGPESEKVRQWCARCPWVRWVGPKFGKEKVMHTAMAQIMLNPGLVGLGILDAFCCGVPMMTTKCGIHSPEIAYLDNGRNGIMTADNLDEYVAQCVDLLRNPTRLESLRTGCFASAKEFTVEKMASRFADGIDKALHAKGGSDEPK